MRTVILQLPEFLKSAGYIQVALTRSEVGHFHANGLLCGHEVSILVDTGASSTIVSLAVAHELNLKLSLHAEKGGGAGGSAMDVHVIEGATLDLAGLRVRTRHLLAMDLSHANATLVASGAEPIEAILGLDAFETHAAVIDYESRSLFLRP